MNYQTDSIHSDSAEVELARSKNVYHTDKALHRNSFSDGSGNQQLSLSGKFCAFHLNLNQNKKHLQMPCEVSAPSPCKLLRQAAKIPAGSVSLLEEHKSLTLPLTPPQQVAAPNQAGLTHLKLTGERPDGNTQGKELLPTARMANER